jgi:hypothetical protein
MMRWLEEFELKHMEFLRCIRSFDTLRSSWSSIEAKEAREAYAAYARRQADTYKRLHDQAQLLFKENAEPILYDSRDDLVTALQDLRKHELGWLWRMAGVEVGKGEEPIMAQSAKKKRAVIGKGRERGAMELDAEMETETEKKRALGKGKGAEIEDVDMDG